MKKSAIWLEKADTVATALEDIVKGEVVSITDTEGCDAMQVTALGDIPRGHKIALRDLAEGDAVTKYGQALGYASQPIVLGDYVHTHNLASARGRGDL